MPGANCLFPQCTNSRYKRKGISEEPTIAFFSITNRKGEFYQKWKNELLTIVKRYREDIDAEFLEKFNNGKKWICSAHYLPEDIETTGKFLPQYSNFLFYLKVSTAAPYLDPLPRLLISEIISK